MLRELQLTDDFSLRVQRKDEEQTGLIVFRPHELEETTAASAKETRKILGLDPETREFNLTYGAIHKDDKEIAMVTRSMLEILAESSVGVEVPASDIEEGRVSKPVETVAKEEGKRRFLIHTRLPGF